MSTITIGDESLKETLKPIESRRKMAYADHLRLKCSSPLSNTYKSMLHMKEGLMNMGLGQSKISSQTSIGSNQQKKQLIDLKLVLDKGPNRLNYETISKLSPIKREKTDLPINLNRTKMNLPNIDGETLGC